MDIFKLLSTLAVFLFGTVWAFRNLRAIFEKVNEAAGIEPRQRITTTTDSGTKLTITTSNTTSNTGAE